MYTAYLKEFVISYGVISSLKCTNWTTRVPEQYGY